MTDSLWLRDMVILGQGAPNSIKKLHGAQGRCLCLWSEKTSYCRIYPVPYSIGKDWQIIDCKVRKSKTDNRENSFAVYNYEKEWPKLSGIIYKNKLDRNAQIKLSRKLAIDSFSEIRDKKRSFGLIKPDKMKLFLRKNLEKTQAQTNLVNFDVGNLDYMIMNQNDFAWIPCLEYSCSANCKSKHPHTSKIVEWGAYQFMRTNPNNYEYCQKLSDNYNIGKPNYEHYVLIGNLRNYPKTYIVVKIIRFKTVTKKDILEMKKEHKLWEQLSPTIL